VWRTGRITDGMWSGWRKLQESVLSSPTSEPNLPEWPFQEQRGSGLAASAPALYVPAPAYSNFPWPLQRLCECGAEEQTVDHVVIHCPIHRPPFGVHGLTHLDDETIE